MESWTLQRAHHLLERKEQLVSDLSKHLIYSEDGSQGMRSVPNSRGGFAGGSGSRPRTSQLESSKYLSRARTLVDELNAHLASAPSTPSVTSMAAVHGFQYPELRPKDKYYQLMRKHTSGSPAPGATPVGSSGWAGPSSGTTPNTHQKGRTLPPPGTPLPGGKLEPGGTSLPGNTPLPGGTPLSGRYSLPGSASMSPGVASRTNHGALTQPPSSTPPPHLSAIPHRQPPKTATSAPNMLGDRSFRNNFRRPEWLKGMDALPPRHRAYRDHSYNSWVNNNHVPGLTCMPTEQQLELEEHARQASAAQADVWIRPPSPEDNTPLANTLANTPAKHPSRITTASSRASELAPIEEDDNQKRMLFVMNQLRTLLYKQHMAHMDCSKKAMAKERELSAVFDVLDTDGNGVVTLREFAEVAHRIMPYLSDDQIEELYSSFDRDSDGVVDYLEFMYANLQGQGRLEQEFLQKSIPKKGYEKYEMIANALKQSTRHNLRMKRGTLLASEIKDSIHKKLSVAEPELHLAMQYVRNQIPFTVPVRPGGDLHRMFQFYDKKRTGTISGKEFKEAFALLRLPVDESHLNFIIRKLDRNKTGDLDYAEFMRFFKHQRSVYHPLGR